MSIENKKAEFERKQKILSESVDEIAEESIQEASDRLFKIKKRMGRPRKKESDKRENNKVSVYLNQEELANIREMAASAGTSISDFIRTKLFL